MTSMTERDDSKRIGFMESRPIEKGYWEATMEGFRWVKHKTPSRTEIMTEYETLLTAITIKPKDEQINSIGATKITLEDDGAGRYVAVVQNGGHQIGICPDEWPPMRDAIDRMIAACAEAADK